MATGHYVRSRSTDEGRVLLRPVDLDRDQSYFLFATTRQQLDFLRFPLGDLTKAETREIARELGLAVADKRDSQDICFVPQGRYAEVVTKLRPEAGEPGEIVHLDGRRLGRHDGFIRFTVGQRRGLGIAAGEPLYVVRIEPASRRVVVGPRAALECRDLVLREVNWLGADEAAATHAVIPAKAGIDSGETVVLADPVSSGTSAMAPGLRRVAGRATEGDDIFVKIRSTQPPVPARLLRRVADALVQIPAGEVGVAPGQACVFYEGAGSGVRVLGGGWIARAEAQWQRNGAMPVQAGGMRRCLSEGRLNA
jgi:tRNA-uridine 2-sulfurtransferase